MIFGPKYKELIYRKLVQKDSIKIALVEYTNTLPFQWAFDKLGKKHKIDLFLENPAHCAQNLLQGNVDLALVPVGAIRNKVDFQYATDYGIACDGSVGTVCIYSNQSIEKIEHLYLDDHSRTSQLLALIICTQYLELDIEYSILNVGDLELADNEAVLMIGDKVFASKDKYKYTYDLGELWKEWTGLPFVFAVWGYMRGNQLDESFISSINKAFTDEVDELHASIESKISKGIISENMRMYFRKNIHYRLTKSKRMGLNLFLEKTKNIVLERPIKGDELKTMTASRH